MPKSSSPGKEPSAADALSWMRLRRSCGREVLFRGQTRVYGTALPSLYRPNVAPSDRNAWWAILRQFVWAANGWASYPIESPHHAVAVVQHYLLRSPVIDVTSSPEIALYFAMMEPASQAERVVYTVDAWTLKEKGFSVIDSDFFVHDVQENEVEHRWVRQKGYTIGVRKWNDHQAAEKLDFLNLPGVEHFTFRRLAGNERLVSNLGDLETVEGDRLAYQIRSVFESIAIHLGLLASFERLIVGSKTGNARLQLVEEIEALLARAKTERFAKDDLSEIQKLLDAAIGRFWDEAWECSLTFWNKKVIGARGGPDE